MPQYDESFLIDCAIGEREKTRSYTITSAVAAATATDENFKIGKKRKRWHSFKTRAPQPQTHAVYRSLYSLIDNIDDTESVCKLLFHANDTKNFKNKINKMRNEAICSMLLQFCSR